MTMTIETAIQTANELANSDYHINAGSTREASYKIWEKDGKKRAYIKIYCYTLAGAYKGAYDCGYIDMVTMQYVHTKYDAVNLETRECDNIINRR